MSGRFESGICNKSYAHCSIQHPFIWGNAKEAPQWVAVTCILFQPHSPQSTVNFLLWLHAVLVIVPCNEPNSCIGFAKFFQYWYWKSPKMDLGISDYRYWLQYRLIAFMIVWCPMLPSCTLVLAKIIVRLFVNAYSNFWHLIFASSSFIR